MTETLLEQARFNMIEQQIRPWEVLDDRVLDVIGSTPRELFVPERYRKLAFVDFEVPLGHDQFMMAPKVEGRMLQALDISPDDSVLEIGTGSGFVTACLAGLSRDVLSVDVIADFTQTAGEKLAHANIDNAVLTTGDVCGDWQAPRRYDVIAVTGSLPEYHDRFEQSLAIGGRLFVVIGEPPVMRAWIINRVSEQEFARMSLFETSLRPLINARKAPVFDF